MEIYLIGGSPCSGKSTIAQVLAEEYGLHVFKVDDHLHQYTKMGARDGKECCAGVANMSPDKIWLRPPEVQCREELQIYEEIFEYILADLECLAHKAGVITEGAAYLPALAKRKHIPFNRYISITPTKGFQVFHYSKREWVPFVLDGCSDRKRAFANWMERDALFAKAVQGQCTEYGYASLINRGDQSVKELSDIVAVHFGLSE